MMIESTVRKAKRWAAVAAVVPLFAIGGGANAVVYVANWDPLFNPQFSADNGGMDLSWAGSATFDVSNPCVAPSTTVTFPDACGTAGMMSFSVSLSATTPPFGGGFAGTGIVPFALASSVRFDSSGIMDGVTLPSPFELTSPGFPLTINGIDYDVFLNFVINASYSGPELTLRIIGCEFDCSYVSDTSGDPNSPYTPNVTFAVVPEPATLALMGIGLLAAGAARRRR